VYASVLGGVCNTASGKCSTIGGGRGNTASGYFSTIAGGCNTTASGYLSTVSGGCSNTSSGERSVVGGGSGNNAIGDYGTVGGGQFNTTCGQGSVIGGGFFNNTPGTLSAILGGIFNVAGGSSSAVLGGQNNTACCACSAAANNSQTTSSTCQFRVNALSKASGTFRIDHPNPTKKYTHYLSHSFVESPTSGDNIYRYKVNIVNGTAVVNLPSYYKYLNENDQIWVTPQGHFGIGYGTINVEQTQLTVHGNADGEYNVLLIGTRKDFDAVHHWQGVETYK